MSGINFSITAENSFEANKVALKTAKAELTTSCVKLKTNPRSVILEYQIMDRLRQRVGN